MKMQMNNLKEAFLAFSLYDIYCLWFIDLREKKFELLKQQQDNISLYY